MGLLQLFSLLAVASSIAANPIPADDPAGETTVSVTVTVTSNPTTEIPVITRTLTRTVYTKTTTLVSQLNCTRTVLVPGATPVTTTASPALPQPTQANVLRRQNSTSVVEPTTARPTIPVPTPPARRRTRTSWVATTVTPSGDLHRTRYECGNTLTYIYNVEATTTQWFTITSHPNVVTSTSLIACRPPGGGRPPFPTGGGQGGGAPTRRPPVPSSSAVSATLTAPPAPSAMPGMSMMIRQENVTSAAGYRNQTVTLHITNTVYRFTTEISNSTSTAVGWACSPANTTVAPSTTAEASIPVTTSVTVLPRPPVSAGSTSAILTLSRPTLPTVSESQSAVVPSPSPVKPTE